MLLAEMKRQGVKIPDPPPDSRTHEDARVPFASATEQEHARQHRSRLDAARERAYRRAAEALRWRQIDDPPDERPELQWDAKLKRHYRDMGRLVRCTDGGFAPEAYARENGIAC
jgi:hypothetical protein